jgi:hypothetical protein
VRREERREQGVRILLHRVGKDSGRFEI